MIMALWDETPCKFINWVYFRHTCYLHLRSQKIGNKETKLSRYTEWEHEARLCTSQSETSFSHTTYYSTLKTEPADYSETLVHIYPTKVCHIL